MRKLVISFGLLGAIWMVFLIHSRQIQLAYSSNYPGFLALRSTRFRGIAPPPWMVWGANVWMVLSSGIEWAVVAFVLVSTARRIYQRRTSRPNLRSSI